MNQRRIAKKALAREAKFTRRDLVHAAGCVEPNCVSKWYEEAGAVGELIEMTGLGPAPEKSVSVPRSLRKYLGRHFGIR